MQKQTRIYDITVIYDSSVDDCNNTSQLEPFVATILEHHEKNFKKLDISKIKNNLFDRPERYIIKADKEKLRYRYLDDTLYDVE